MAERSMILHVDGPNVLGDLTVTGFGSSVGMQEIGDGFAKVLLDRFPGARVTVHICPPVTPVAARSHGSTDA